MTKRRIADLVFTVFLAAVALFAFLGARDWPSGARQFPVAVSIGLGLLVLAQFVLIMVQGRRAGADATDRALWPDVAPALARRRALVTAATIVVMAVSVWLFGFPIGGPLVLGGHLLLVMRERLLTTGVMVAGSVVALWALSSLLNIPFPDPVLPFLSNPF